MKNKPHKGAPQHPAVRFLRTTFFLCFYAFLMLSIQGSGGTQCERRTNADAQLRIANFTSIQGGLDATWANAPLASGVGNDIASCYEAVQPGPGTAVVRKHNTTTQVLSATGTAGGNWNRTLVMWGDEGNVQHVWTATGDISTINVAFQVVHGMASGAYDVYVTKQGTDLNTVNRDGEISTSARVAGPLDSYSPEDAHTVSLTLPGTKTVVASVHVPAFEPTTEIVVLFRDAGTNFGGGSIEGAWVSTQCEGPLHITTNGLDDVELNHGYLRTLTASGGSGAGYQWSVTSGSLPPGMTLDQQSGLISGTPTQIGNFQFTVQVQDNEGNTATKVFTIVVFDPQAGGTFGRFINASPNAQNATLSATFGNISVDDANYGFGGSTVVLSPGTANVVVRRGTTTVGSASATVAADTRNAFVAVGNNATGLGVVHVSRATSYTPPSGQIAIYLVQGLSAYNGGVDYYIVPQGASILGQTPVAAGYTYQEWTRVEWNTGDWDIVAAFHGTTSEMFRTPISYSLDGANVTAVAVSPTGQPGSFRIVQD